MIKKKPSNIRQKNLNSYGISSSSYPTNHNNHNYSNYSNYHKKIKLLHSRTSALSFLIALLAIGIAIFAAFNIQQIRTTGFAILGIHAAGDTATIAIDPRVSIGIVRNDFYGANTHGSWLGDGTKIDTDGDGTAETQSDLAWHRQAWLDSGMKLMRWDANLENLYEYDNWTDLDFEAWSDPSIKYINKDSETGANGWKISTYGGGEGYVSQSTDSHSGQYSLNVTTTKDDHLFVYRKANLKEGYNYNFSVWLKGNGSFSAIIQRMDNYQSCGYISINLNNSAWEKISLNCTVTDIPQQGYRIVIDSIDKDEILLIDNFELKEDNQDFKEDFYFNGDLTSKINQIKWAKDKNIEILLIIAYMPNWLSDINNQGCNISSKNASRCPPYNYYIWGDIVLDYLDRLTLNGTYSDSLDIEVWNEPDIGFWLGNLPTDDIEKSVQYNILYDYTYDIIKSRYPSIQVGGPAIASTSNTNLVSSFIDNFYDKSDFFSLHRYSDNEYDNLLSDVTSILESYASKGINSKRIIISEWNSYNDTAKSNASNYKKYSANIAGGYTSLINNYPQRVNLILYQWTDHFKYSDSAHYPQYPQKWNMVSEPALDNEFTPAYNVTKDFAHYHAGGNVIVESTSDNTGVKSVASINSSGFLHITLISTSATNVTALIDLGGTDVEYLRDLSNGQLIVGNNGMFNVGNLSQYDVKHYENVDAQVALNDSTAPEVTINYPTSTTYNLDNLTLSVTINEDGVCNSSFNDISNRTMNTLDNRTFTKNERDLVSDDYVARFYCTDRAGNTAMARVHFTISLASDPVVTPGSTGGSGGGGGGGGSVTTLSGNTTSDTNITNIGTNTNNNDSIDTTGSTGSTYEVPENEINYTEESENGGKTTLAGRAITNLDEVGGKTSTKIIIVLIIGIIMVTIALLLLKYFKHHRRDKYITTLRLKDWIHKARQIGHNEPAMENMLVANGWDRNIVKKALEETKNNDTKTPGSKL